MTRVRTTHLVWWRLHRLLTTMLTLVGMAILFTAGCDPATAVLPDEEDGYGSVDDTSEEVNFTIEGIVTINMEMIEDAVVVAFDNNQELVDETTTNEHGEFILLVNEGTAVSVVAGVEIDGIGFIASAETVMSGSVLDLSLSAANASSQARLNCWQAGCWWRLVLSCCDSNWGPICSWVWGRCN